MTHNEKPNKTQTLTVIEATPPSLYTPKYQSAKQSIIKLKI